MLARVISGATVGLDSVKVEVEVDLPDQGFPGLFIVGLPGKAVKEACERVRSAIKNSDCKWPNKRITVNLTPADLPKEGPAYDLPIAIGMLIADDQAPEPAYPFLAFGELSLDGTLRPTAGALPLSLLAKELGCQAVFLPQENAAEAAMITGLTVIPVQSLAQLLAHLRGQEIIAPHAFQPIQSHQSSHHTALLDMADVKGQEQAKRVMEIAAAGGHNVFLIGSPGSGKTMLARTLPSILPEMAEAEMLEVTKIYSVAGKLNSETSAVTTRPFRSPHHTTSMAGLIGGGSHPKPGEITLAHRGVLFCDEFLEFPRLVLECLRQPLEDGLVTVSRAAGSLQFPARFLLVAAANPCPCGYLYSKKKSCTCMPGIVDRYQKRLSGPILDRIDLHVTVPEVEVEKLGEHYQGEPSVAIRQRVNEARKRQLKRYQTLQVPVYCNAEMNSKQVRLLCPLSQECQQLLQKAAQTLGLSARSYYRMIKVARTIADLANRDEIEVGHLAEALQYRPKVEE